ncbi:MAG: DUF1428 domain-containing protein [Pseudomonadota bacterium]
MSYIDGFVMAVPTANREKFQAHCETADSWFLENGATRVVETWGADVPKGETTDLIKAVAATEEETVSFGWIEWPNKKTRDAAMAKMEGGEGIDERLDPEKNPMPFDGKRMIFGSFEAIYDQSA